MTCPIRHDPIHAEDRTCITDLGKIHGACCVQCRSADELLADPVLVERAKRGHRRGTPKRWSLIGRGS